MFYFLLFIIGVQALVFTIKPSHGWRTRVFVLALATMLGHALLNIALQSHRQKERDDYQTCQNQFPDGAVQHHPECGEINIADGASNVFFLFFAWVPTVLYIGIAFVLRRRFYDYAKHKSAPFSFFHRMLFTLQPVFILFAVLIMGILYLRYSPH